MRMHLVQPGIAKQSVAVAVPRPLSRAFATVAAAAANGSAATLGDVPRIFKLAALDTHAATAVIDGPASVR